jgi:hypothetical protein
MHMAVSWVFMFIFGPFFFREYDPQPMLYLWCVATFLLLLHGFARRSEEAKGYRCHSLFTGRSIFRGIAGSERLAKTLFEPIAFIGAGLFIGQYSVPMCAYFIVVAIGMKVSAEWMAQVEDAQIQAAEDAWHDAQYMQNELQKRIGE